MTNHSYKSHLTPKVFRIYSIRTLQGQLKCGAILGDLVDPYSRTDPGYGRERNLSVLSKLDLATFARLLHSTSSTGFLLFVTVIR